LSLGRFNFLLPYLLYLPVLHPAHRGVNLRLSDILYLYSFEMLKPESHPAFIGIERFLVCFLFQPAEACFFKSHFRKVAEPVYSP
ncbi:hypothetical protein DRK20_24175, partial [Salmonella enterica subsp. enterica serovar Kirkee]|nr:hypothetical protein [Salmonella enterica subsp. enterica serovar Kirkee]